MNRNLPIISAAVVLSSVLAACGGGSSSDNNVVLPIDDSAPQAYTVQYLVQHPNTLIQPEHLLVINLDPSAPDGGRVSVRLNVRDELSVEMGTSSSAPQLQALSEIIVVDAGGVVRMHYRDGRGPVSVDLRPGEHIVTFVPKADLTQARPVFMKLADTPTQAANRPSGGSGLGAIGPTLGATQFGEQCTGCNFNDSDLTGANFFGSGLENATFHNAVLSYANFERAFCGGCIFTSDGTPAMALQDTNFNGAVLNLAVFDRPYYSSVGFKGAPLAHATLRGAFIDCDFSPYTAPGQAAASAYLANADLTAARFDSTNIFTSAVFTSSSVATTTFKLSQGSPGTMRNAFTGAVLDNITPGTVFADSGQSFAGYDLSGTSFVGIDLSTQDFSVGAGTTITDATNIAQSILSNGTVGINLSGQRFPTAYIGFAGTIADASSGRNLAHVNFNNVSLYQADLTRAVLDGATLIGADLTYANLYGASLKGAQLGVEPGTGTQPAGRLSSAYMPHAILSDADLRSVDLSNAHLYGTTVLDRARLDGASLAGAMLMQASFVSASLSGANLTGASLISANFDSAILSNAKFDGAYVQGANFATAASVVGLSLTNGAVSTTAGSWAYTEIDGTPFSFPYSATALGQLGTSSQVVCPNGDTGPCIAAKLVPIKTPPYPIKPPCTPLRQYRYLNCEAGWVPPTT